MTVWSQKSAKQHQRAAFFDGVGPRANYLSLTGGDCEDVRVGRELKVLGDATHIIAVEREKTVFKQINQWFISHWPEVSRQLIWDDMASVTNLGKLDLVFLDYVGNITARDADWIRSTLVPSLTPKAHIGITTTLPLRGNQFIPSIEAMIKRRFSDYYFTCFTRLRDKVDTEGGGEARDLIPRLTIYSILISCYLFADVPSLQLKIDYHKEKVEKQTDYHARVILFQLTKTKNLTPLTPYDRQVYDAIHAEVNSGNLMESSFSLPSPKKGRSLMSTGNEVVDAIVNASTAGTKAAATRKLNRFVEERAAETGKDPKWIKAGIKSRVSRVQNGNA